MESEKTREVIRTRIWLEEPESDNSFATRAAYCHGYDVYGEMLGRARWVEMLFLLFRGEAPTSAQADVLEATAVALMNAGPRDPAVHAAMCGGVGGSTAASSLMAALAVGAGQQAGAREVFLAMQAWNECGTDLGLWTARFARQEPLIASVWPATDHPSGFEAHGAAVATIVTQTLAVLAARSPGALLPWLQANRSGLERAAGHPLAMSGVAAASFADLGFTPEQAEMLHLLLRLPGAAAHALEQWQYGHKQFPFFALELDSAASPEAA
jgi:citrate synthase